MVTTGDEYLEQETALLEGSASRATPVGTTKAFWVSTAIAALGAGQFGFHLGVLNVPQTCIEGDLGIPHNSFKWSAIVAAFTISGFVAAQTSAGLVDRLGRRRFLVLAQLVFIMAGGLFLAAGLSRARPTVSYPLLIVGRVLAGIAAGAASMAVPMYLGEIATLSNKGALGTLNQAAITLFILISQAVGVGMSTSSLWGWMLLITAGVGAVAVLASPFLLESPRWLIAQGRTNEARRVLLALRGYTEADADQEIAEAQDAAARQTQSSSMSLVEVIREPSYRAPLLVAVVLQIAQQLSGINAVFFFSTSFFQDAGIQNANLGTLATGAVNVAATLVAVYLIDRLGRKPLLIWGTLGMLIAAAVLTVTLEMKDHGKGSASGLGAFSIVVVLLYVCFFEIGLGPIPWLLGGEMLPESPRAAVMSVAASANWIFTTVVALAFPSVQSALNSLSFLPFCGFLLATLLFTVSMVPETRGKQPHEVLAWFKNRRTGGGSGVADTAKYAPVVIAASA